MKRLTTLNTTGGTFNAGMTMEYGATLNIGGTELGNSSRVNISELTLNYGARVVLDVNGTEDADTNGTLQAKDSGGTSLNPNNVVRERYIVRRLTPTECERLQGYPDGWTDIGEWTDTKGKKHKPADSPRYKALGNSIAIPPWLFVLSRLNEYCEEKTMASLFDGIGGFPLIWEFLNGTGSAVWCSEIEEFPIAVTKIRFPERSDESP